MCGLSFLYDPTASSSALEAKMRQSLSLLRHRGPDAQGVQIDYPWIMGHRRLSIVDLIASRQPMWDPQRRYCLAYNGEIYNYTELRAQLDHAWQFETKGDTEVLLAGLTLLGPEFLDRAEGMWAFTLWDRKACRLMVGRDRLGKKPLYYQFIPDGIACASELPALRTLSKGQWKEDPDSIADYFRYGYYLPGTTAYCGVIEVLPGHWGVWSPGQALDQQAYWKLRLDPFIGSRQAARERLAETLTVAVRRRMVADVEVGAFLSGGIDSSLVVAIMAQQFGTQPKTFSIGFDESSFDERPYARLLASYCKTDHYETCLESWDRKQLIDLILHNMGQPFYDPSLLPTALVSRLAAERVKVSLSGDGGDELFSGYQRYQARLLMRWYTRLPPGVRHMAERVVRALPEPVAHHSRSLLKKAHLFLDIAARQGDESPYVAPRLYAQSELARLLPDLHGYGHRPPGLPDEARLDQVYEMMAGDALVYLPQDILAKVDRASMAYGLETRTPFLDRDLIELAFSFPRYWHRRRFKGKRMLHESFGDLLPPALWRRRKQGFGVPIHNWFRRGLGDETLELLMNSETPVDSDYARQLLREHLDGRRDNGYRLWNLYVYLVFHHQVSNQINASPLEATIG